VPITLANIHSDYVEIETSLEYRLRNGRRLILRFAVDGSLQLELDAAFGEVRSSRHFEAVYPVATAIRALTNPFFSRAALA
jgi:hypothetical protein